MKKLIMVLTLASILGACTSTTTTSSVERMSTAKVESNESSEWWQTAGDPDGEYWWVSFEDESE